MNEQLEKALDQWRQWDRDETTRAQIEALVTASNYAELTKLLCSRMAFGTAGLRSRMGAGFSQMNTLTIIQTVQGLLTYVKTQFSQEELTQRGICVGFDARYNSDKYGKLTAQIFARGGVRVRLFKDIVPTPYVAFNVREYNCVAGVMCTASHNPKEDNGYKVYWSDGAQIIPPHDKGIAAAIDANLAPWEDSWTLPDDIYAHPLVEDPTASTDKDYTDKLATYVMNKAQNQATKLRFTYTPVHGVGTRAVKAAMCVFGLPELIEVELQKKPDPDFPTVKFPNPEEGAGVLELAMAAAEQGNSKHILASDPDADRLAVAEKTDKWRVFTGNELGALFGWWAVQCWKKRGGLNPTTTFMLASTVSSKILDTIAKKEGIKFEDTLTGFKWMGSRSKKLIDQGNNVIFAFEEAIGFMYGSNVLDKDGVSAAAVMAEFIVELDKQGKTLGDQLESIYAEYGFHMTNNSYFICHEKPTIIKMFDRLRKWDNGRENTYPPALGDFKIAHVRDLTTGYDSREADFNAMAEITKEIAGKLRLAIKRKMHTLDIDQDDDMLEFMLTLFARKKRYPQLVDDLEALLDEKSKPFAAWLDDLIRKVNKLPANEECEEYKIQQEKKQKALEISSESEDEPENEQKLSEENSSDEDDDVVVKRRSRSRSRSPINSSQPRVNIFLDDARALHDVEEEKERLKRQMKRLHSQVSSVSKKDAKKVRRSFLGINEQFERLLEKCDSLQLDQRDEQNRAHRKVIIRDVQMLLDRNDRAMSFLPKK